MTKGAQPLAVARLPGGFLLRAEQGRLRATVIVRGRHRCLVLTEEAIERLRDPEEPEVTCRIEELARSAE